MGCGRIEFLAALFCSYHIVVQRLRRRFSFQCNFIMTLDIFTTHLTMVMVLLLVAIVGKLVGAGLGARMGGMNIKETSLVAFSMNGRGAVELIIASVGIELGIINDVYFSILVVVAFITTLFPPVAMSALLNRYGYEGLKKLDKGTESP